MTFGMPDSRFVYKWLNSDTQINTKTWKKAEYSTKYETHEAIIGKVFICKTNGEFNNAYDVLCFNVLFYQWYYTKIKVEKYSLKRIPHLIFYLNTGCWHLMYCFEGIWAIANTFNLINQK